MARCFQLKSLTAKHRRQRGGVQCENVAFRERTHCEEALWNHMPLCNSSALWQCMLPAAPLRLILTLTWNPEALSSSSTIFQVSSRASGLVSGVEDFLSPRDLFRFTFFFCKVSRTRYTYFEQTLMTRIHKHYKLSPWTYLNHQVFATFAEVFQHAQKEMSWLHQVFEVGLRLAGFIILPQQCKENLSVLHQVEYVT